MLTSIAVDRSHHITFHSIPFHSIPLHFTAPKIDATRKIQIPKQVFRNLHFEGVAEEAGHRMDEAIQERNVEGEERGIEKTKSGTNGAIQSVDD